MKTTNSLRNARLKITAEYSKEANQKSHSIVLSLLEPRISEKYLIEKISFISPDNYEDVVTERAIGNICGYPLCQSPLTEEFGKQTYIIRQNRVYDITQRRNFCSNKCYEASELILKQIPKTPLYTREADKEIKNSKIKIPDLTQLKGRWGKLVNITGCSGETEEEFLNTLERLNNKIKKKSKCKEPGSSASSSSASVPSPADTSIQNASSLGDSSFFGLSPSRVSITDSDLSDEIQKLGVIDADEAAHSSDSALLSDSLSADGGCLARQEPGDECQINKTNTKKDASMEDIYEIENGLRQWMTFESLRTVLGDVYVRGMLEDLGKSWHDYDSTAGLRLTVESKSRYVSLCKKLDMEEKRENLLDTKELLECQEIPQLSDRNPVPDYEQLKKDVEESSLKVKAFFEGTEALVRGKPLSTIPEEEEETVSAKKGKKKKKDPAPADDDASVTLPLIDSYAQKTWRRRILCDKLRKPLSNLAVDFGLDEAEVQRLTFSLVATFDLSPHTISYKTQQWKLIALVMLKMLSVRYDIIREALDSEDKGQHLVSSLLQEVYLDTNYLNRLMAYLTEISYILTKYHGETAQSTQLRGAEEMNDICRTHSKGDVEELDTCGTPAGTKTDRRRTSDTHPIGVEFETSTYATQSRGIEKNSGPKQEDGSVLVVKGDTTKEFEDLGTRGRKKTFETSIPEPQEQTHEEKKSTLIDELD